uniref:Secreted protein n=1 Tax=Caenorhabditis tropicalis TaxID=1561998 RepID=A0A1I7TLX7_9PELO
MRVHSLTYVSSSSSFFSVTICVSVSQLIQNGRKEDECKRVFSLFLSNLLHTFPTNYTNIRKREREREIEREIRQT